MRSGKGQRMHRRNDNMHTHAHVELQSGAKIWATTRPEKKTDNASGAARSGIWYLTRCPGALWAVGPKGERGRCSN